MDAIEAELAGDRAHAVALLEPLVRDSSAYWDYSLRAALARNLAALGRTRELKDLCDATAKPAVFRWAWLPLMRTCARR